jgi:hypothetical protein
LPPPPPPPSGSPTQDGRLVKDASSPAIYVVENGMKRPFVSFAVFTGLGFKASNVVTTDTSSLPLGPGIFTANQRHVRGSVVLDNGTVYFLGATVRYPFPSATVFFSWGHSFSLVLPANSYDKAMPIGPVATMKP